MGDLEFNLNELQELLSYPTREIQSRIKQFDFLLKNAHAPSEGEYFEYLLRDYLKRRLPKRFEVSTGFISTLESSLDLSNSQKEIVRTRRTSRQFDILIWDSQDYSPLIQADNFVILMPESVRAIIEVTKTLDSIKLEKDLNKLDSIYDFYSFKRPKFRPYLSILGFSSSLIKTLLNSLEKFYLFKSSLPVLFRYNFWHKSLYHHHRTYSKAPFINSICSLERGFIQARPVDNRKNPKLLYESYEHSKDIQFALGLFEQDLLHYINTFNSTQISIDASQEFQTTFALPSSTKSINDLQSFIPDGDVRQLKEQFKKIPFFIGADFSRDEPDPLMYVKYFEENNAIWVFEKHFDNLFAIGQYKNSERIGKWRLFGFDKTLEKSKTVLIEDINMTYSLQYPNS